MTSHVMVKKWSLFITAHNSTLTPSLPTSLPNKLSLRLVLVALTSLKVMVLTRVCFGSFLFYATYSPWATLHVKECWSFLSLCSCCIYQNIMQLSGLIHFFLYKAIEDIIQQTVRAWSHKGTYQIESQFCHSVAICQWFTQWTCSILPLVC